MRVSNLENFISIDPNGQETPINIYETTEDFTKNQIVPVQKLQDTLVLGDCFQLLKYIPDNSIKVIIIDPPYHVSKRRVFTRDDAEDINMDFGEWDFFGEGTEGVVNYLNYIFNMCKELYRVLAEDGTLFVFCTDTYNSFIAHYMKYTLHMIFKGTYLWYKKNPPTRFHKNSFAWASEFCCIAQKTKDATFNFQKQNEMKNWMKTEMEFTYESGLVSGKERIKYYSKEKKKWITLHPTQKPEELIRRFILIASNEGDLIADFMMGVGTTPTVAKKENRKFFGSEIDPKYFHPTVQRVQKARVRKIYHLKTKPVERKTPIQTTLG